VIDPTLPDVPSFDADLSTFADCLTAYESQGRTLPGAFVTPAGDGPFPGIVFHHGSAGLMAAARTSIEMLVGSGFAVFAPIRRGHNGSDGPFWQTLVTHPWGSAEMGPQLVEALDSESDDAIAALEWMRAHPRVDSDRIVIAGSSFGGVMVMLLAGRGARCRAGISFAGPSITWPDAPALQEHLVAAMGRAEFPLFLIQAADDFHLTPTYVLAGELARLGKPHEVRVYGPIGVNRGDGHGVFNKAPDLWGPDVKRFLDRHLADRA